MKIPAIIFLTSAIGVGIAYAAVAADGAEPRPTQRLGATITEIPVKIDSRYERARTEGGVRIDELSKLWAPPYETLPRYEIRLTQSAVQQCECRYFRESTPYIIEHHRLDINVEIIDLANEKAIARNQFTGTPFGSCSHFESFYGGQGAHVLHASDDKPIKEWIAATLAKTPDVSVIRIPTLWAMKGWGQARFSPNGQYVVVPESGKATLVETVTGKKVGELDVTRGGRDISDVRFSPNSSSVAIAVENRVRILNASTGTLVREIRLKGRATSAAFSSDGKLLTIIETSTFFFPLPEHRTQGNSITVWDIQTGRLLRSLSLSDVLRIVALSPTGPLIAETYARGVAKETLLIDIRTAKPIYTARIDGRCNANDQENTMVCAAKDRVITRDARNGKEITQRSVSGFAALTSSNRIIATIIKNAEVQIRDADSGRLLAQLVVSDQARASNISLANSNPDALNAVFSANGQTLLINTGYDTLLWNISQVGRN